MRLLSHPLTGATIFAAAMMVDGNDFDFDGLKKDCPKFQCGKGYTPVPKSRLKFESTGCSTMGGSVMMNFGAAAVEKPYESCCHKWHACYQVCGVQKKACDKAFDTCGNAKCLDAEDCKKDLQMATMMLNIGGCSSFDQKQYQSCECVPPGKAPLKREAAIRTFYKKHSPEHVDKAANLALKADSPSKLASLFTKLLSKYPGAILVKEDQKMKDIYDAMKTSEKTAEEENEEDDKKTSEKKAEEYYEEDDTASEDNDEERIEL